MALTLKFQMFLIGRGNKLIWRLKRVEKQSAKMYYKISGVKLQKEERLTENQLLEIFRGHSVSQVEQELSRRGICKVYTTLLCAHWSYDPDCP